MTALRRQVGVAAATLALAGVLAAVARADRIHGVVRDPAGVPVANADFDVFTTDGVLLAPDDNSDADGTYEILLAPGFYDLVVEPPVGTGLAPQVVRGLGVGGETRLDWVLPAAARVLGRVIGPDALPVAGVDLDFDRLDDGTRQPALGDITSRFGTFAAWIEPGDYRLTVTPPDSTGLAPARIPSLSIPTADTLAFRLVRAARLEGTVRDASGGPVAEARLAFSRLDTGERVPASGHRTAADGAFRVSVAPGVYAVTVEPPRGTTLAATRIAPVDLSADAHLDAVLEPGVPVTGRVLDRNARPLAGARWSAEREADGERVPTPDDASDPEGRFGFVVPPGTYRLTLRPPAASGLDSLVFPGVRIDAPLAFDVSYATGTRPEISALDIRPAQNPASREAELVLAVPAAGPVRVEVFDTAGRRLRRLVEGVLPAGLHRVRWDGRNDAGARVGTSVYFLLAQQAGRRARGRLVLLP